MGSGTVSLATLTLTTYHLLHELCKLSMLHSGFAVGMPLVVLSSLIIVIVHGAPHAQRGIPQLRQSELALKLDANKVPDSSFPKLKKKEGEPEKVPGGNPTDDQNGTAGLGGAGCQSCGGPRRKCLKW